MVVITARNPVRSVLSLVVTFFAMAGVWMLLRAEFLSLILVLVYVGAVMTLFLFVVMMLNIDIEAKRRGFVRYLPFGVIDCFAVLGIDHDSHWSRVFWPGTHALHLQPEPADYSNIEHLGMCALYRLCLSF